MANELITALRSLVTKAESVPGTAETLTSSDFNIRVKEGSLGIEVPMDETPAKYMTGDFWAGEALPGPQSMKISFSNKFVDKTSGEEPAWTKLIKTCGCHVSGYEGSLGSGYIIFPTEFAIGSGLTIGIYDKMGGLATSGWYYKGKGGVGNCTISTEGAKKPYMMNWEYTLAVSDVGQIAAGSIPSPTSLPTEIPDTFVSGYMTASGTGGVISGCISTMEFNFGNAVTPIECQSSDTGYATFCITKMEPMLTINPAVNLDYDFWSKFNNAKIEQVIISTSMFRLVIPRAQIESVAPADADGIQRVTLTLRPLRATTAETQAGYAAWYMVVNNVD
jgi:hypothetical protein